MDSDRLEKLKQRTERAKVLADEIERLNAASPYSLCTLEFRAWNTNTDLLPETLLKEVVESGRLSILAKKESELEAIVGIEPTELKEPDLRRLLPEYSASPVMLREGGKVEGWNK